MSMNKDSQATFTLMLRLWRCLSSRRKKQLVLTILLMVVVSIAEVLNIASIMPFMGALIDPERLLSNQYLKPLIKFLAIKDASGLLIPMAVLFGLITIITNALRLLLLWVTTGLSLAIATTLSVDAFTRTLYQPYLTHISRNSSETINGIGKVSSIVNVINISLSFVSSIAILISILATIFFIDPLVAASCIGVFGLGYSGLIYFFRERLYASSLSVARESNRTSKILQESLGGIRDILIDGTQQVYMRVYEHADHNLKEAQRKIVIIGGAPRFIMEAFGMILILSIACILVLGNRGIYGGLPILGVLGLAAQRLLPVLQNAYSCWSGIQGSKASLNDALNLLEQPLPSDYSLVDDVREFSFEKAITLENINFRYKSGAPLTLKNMNLKILSGTKVGIIGKTGGGKSTIVDIIMGLIPPTEGRILIDGVEIDPRGIRAWQRLIAHVPQFIYLADTTLAENIAFGVPKELIDNKKIIEAARLACLEELVESWPEKYQTHIGERGIRLSGGQRQRIGIARALYKNAKVIIFDEATSALDSGTESNIMASLNSLKKDLTILIIAHRLSTLKSCDLIVEISNGEISRTGSYEDICLPLLR